MEERQVTVEGEAHPLPDPFVVIATQNPIEYEGTYPLPEAQLDRFLFKLQVGYPTAEQEQEVLARHDRGLDPHDLAAAGVRPVATADDLAEGRRRVEALQVEPAGAGLRRRHRAGHPGVAVAGPRRVAPGRRPACCTAAKAWAWLAGRDFVTPDEVKAVARPRCATASCCAPSWSSRGPRPTACSTASWPPSRRPASRDAPCPIPTRRLAVVLAVASVVVLALGDRGVGHARWLVDGVAAAWSPSSTWSSRRRPGASR